MLVYVTSAGADFNGSSCVTTVKYHPDTSILEKEVANRANGWPSDIQELWLIDPNNLGLPYVGKFAVITTTNIGNAIWLESINEPCTTLQEE